MPNKPNEKGIVTWSWPGCPMAEGLYDYSKMVDSLRKVGYKGFISVEDFRTEVSPEDRLENAIRFLRGL
jgi:sugar phosphate isomerase/epimerase